MTLLKRLAAASGLAVLFLAAPVSAETGFLDLTPPSASGNFLAGSEALSELRTPEAARFFADAAAEQWDNPLVLNRAFIAFAAKEAGIKVYGVDSGWDGGWRGRQDRMYEQVKQHLKT